MSCVLGTHETLECVRKGQDSSCDRLIQLFAAISQIHSKFSYSVGGGRNVIFFCVSSLVHRLYIPCRAPYSKSVCTYMCSRIHACVWMLTHVHMDVSERPEVNLQCPSAGTCPPQFLRQGFSLNQEFVKSTTPTGYANHHLVSACFGLACNNMPSSFMWFLGSQTQVLMSARQALCQLWEA